jgi:hypothetical protein
VLQHPRPHGGAVVHDGFSMGAGVLQRDEKKIKNKKKIIFIFFQKKFNPPPPDNGSWLCPDAAPPPHGGAVVHDGSSVGAGVLQRDVKKIK